MVTKSPYAWKRAAQVALSNSKGIDKDYSSQLRSWMIKKLDEYLASTPKVQNPDWNPVNASTSTDANVIVNENSTNTPPSTPVGNVGGKWGQVTSQVGDVTTKSDVVSDTSLTQTQTSISDAEAMKTSQQSMTNELSGWDAEQLDVRTKEAKANYEEAKVISEEQIAMKTQNEIDYQNKINKEKEEEVNALRIAQEKEDVSNTASRALLESKNASAEREMEIANDIELQKSTIAFAKLGLSFSGAAINTAQQIYTTWVYKLAELKTKNAYNIADFDRKVADTQFSHTQAIQKIIHSASDEEFKSKERLREFIWNAQSNLLMSRKDSQKAIQSAIDTYKKERQEREDKLYSDMKKANDEVSTSIKEMQKTIQNDEETTRKRIDLLQSNGQWNSLSPIQQVELEKRAWLPPGTSWNTLIAKTTQGISSLLKAQYGKAIGLTPNILSRMHTEVQRLSKLCYPLNTAMQMAVDKYKDELPDVQTINASNAAKADAEKAKAEKLRAEATAKLRWKTWGWGGGGSWTKPVDLQSKQMEWTEDVPLTWLALESAKILWLPTSIKKKVTWVGNYNKRTWQYTDSKWNVLNDANIIKTDDSSLKKEEKKTDGLIELNLK